MLIVRKEARCGGLVNMHNSTAQCVEYMCDRAHENFVLARMRTFSQSGMGFHHRRETTEVRGGGF
jgi:hypothetical protein